MISPIRLRRVRRAFFFSWDVSRAYRIKMKGRIGCTGEVNSPLAEIVHHSTLGDDIST